MIDDILQRKDKFKTFLKSVPKEDGSVYGDTQINSYCYALEQASSKLKVSTPLVQSNVFGYESLQAFNRAYAIIVEASNYSKVDMATGNRTFSTALMHYSNFLKDSIKNGRTSQVKPNFIKYLEPIISVLRDIGQMDGSSIVASATTIQVRDAIIMKYSIDEVELATTYSDNGANQFMVELGFAGTYLALVGLIDDSIDNVWSLTASGNIIEIDDKVAFTVFRDGLKKIRSKSSRTNAKKCWIYPIDKSVSTKLTQPVEKPKPKDTKSPRIRSVYVGDSGFQVVEPDENANKTVQGKNTSNYANFVENKVITVPFGEIGDLRGFVSKGKIKGSLKQCFGNTADYLKTSLMLWQFVNDMQIGDYIILQQEDKILGRGIVISEYGYDEYRHDGCNHTREVKWTHLGEWTVQNPMRTTTLLDCSKYLGYLECINELFDATMSELEDTDLVFATYTKADFVLDVFMKDDEYDRLRELLYNKKNLILQGSAGVGKTYISTRLAHSIIGEKNPSQIKIIQFHQSYTYEEFFMGYRPTDNGLQLQYGVFYNFCKQAELDDENDYFFIIDEINRGNLSKIFGELFVLIENDKRGTEIQLTYTNELFSIPKNLYIIGMMNTADRGLAFLDYALRRRFGFYEIVPAFDSLGFMGYQAIISNSKFNKLILEVKVLNKDIECDENLGKGFTIGHSYFTNQTAKSVNDDWLKSLIDFEIIPLLGEYWFDEPSKVYEWKKRLNESIN